MFLPNGKLLSPALSLKMPEGDSKIVYIFVAFTLWLTIKDEIV